MKELRISLDEATVKALEAEVAAGEAASIEELIEAALGAWLDPAAPTRAQMLADLAEVDRDLAAGGRLYSADEVRRSLDDDSGE